MKMQVSICVLVILGLASLSEGYNQRHKISSSEHIYAIQEIFVVYSNPQIFNYEITFPQMYNNVTVMAMASSNMDMINTASCPTVHYSAHWYKTLTMNNPDCSGGHYDGKQLNIKCYGQFEITDENYGSFFIALSSCGPMGLNDVLYDFSNEGAPKQISSSTTTVVQLCPLMAMICAMVATLF